MKGTKKKPVEIQIRTLAMNFWATIEHSLQYKYKYNIPEQIRERLNAASAAIINLDNEMSSVHEEIMEAQQSFQYKANMVRDILKISEFVQGCKIKRSNKDARRILQNLKKDDLELLEKFSRELDILAESYRAQSL
jgi:putative GTP pyrophosphokinase